jgi:hypothetical protein
MSYANTYPQTRWQTDRLGVFTASQIYRLLTPPKSKEAKERGDLSETAKAYVQEVAAELVTGTVREVTAYALEWGRQYEPEAAAALRALYPGLAYYGSDNPMFFRYGEFSGGSPDALRGLTQVFEIKCPENPAKHIEYALTPAGELEHVEQIQMNMLAVSRHHGIAFEDMEGIFVSYCPLVSEESNRLKTKTILPDPAFRDLLDLKLTKAKEYLIKVINEFSK